MVYVIIKLFKVRAKGLWSMPDFQVKKRTRGKYPWDDWSDGKVYEVNCEEFEVEPQAFRMSVYGAARQRGLKAATSVEGSIVTFQMLPPDEEE